MAPVYLDYASTTPCDPLVVEKMLPFFTDEFGNPSNPSHPLGLHALEAVEEARERAAELLGVEAHEIVWTSGATESNNLAIHGAAAGHRLWRGAAGGHVVSNVLEHKSVLGPCRAIESEGVEVSYVRPDARGVITAEAVEQALRPDTFLVTAMWGNNETGTVNDVAAISALCRVRGILFHCDATQAIGKLPATSTVDGIDLLSWSSHKMYGPKGVGALFIRASSLQFAIEPRARGGGQEHGIRSGTLNVPGIVGFGAACVLAKDRMSGDPPRLAVLRDRLERAIIAAVPGAAVNGGRASRLPHISNISMTLPALQGNLLEQLSGVACSAGAACGTRDLTPSHVLRALHVPRNLARSTLRFSVGRLTTEADIDRAISETIDVAKRLA